MGSGSKGWAAALGIVLVCAVSAMLAGCGGHANSALDQAAVSGAAQTQVDLDQVLRQLAAMPTPDGVDAVAFSKLKLALHEALVGQARQRFARQAPDSARSVVDDLSINPGSGQIKLRWTYRSEGDFNQDSQVAITDLAQMGMYFGCKTTDSDWGDAQCADGNLNGQVDLPDIVCIAINLLRRVEGYHIQYSVSGDAGGAWDQVQDIAFASSTRPAGQPRYFEANVISAAAGYYRVVPFDSTGAGAPGNIVQYDGASGNAHYETEDNDTSEQADALPALPFPAPLVNGNLGTGNSAGDDNGDAVDWFALAVAEAGQLNLALNLDNTTGDLDLYLYQDPQTTPLGSSTSLTAVEQVSLQVEPGTYFVRCQCANGYSEYTLTGSLNTSGGTHFETENNDTPEDADPLPALTATSQTFTGNLGAGNSPDDDGDGVDWFSFSVDHMGALTLSLDMNDLTSDLDLYLYSDPTAGWLASSANTDNPETISYNLPGPGTYYVKCEPYFGYSEYWLHGSFEPDLSNHAPQAKLSASAFSGVPPLSVDFDASASSDPDPGDGIAKYEFDFGEGAGWEDYGTTATATHAYTGSGAYIARVRVTDGGGLTAEASRHIYTDGSGGGVWNFLVWIAGDNNLAGEGYGDLTEMEAVGSTDNVRVLAGFDIDPSYLTSGTGCDKVRFIKVVQDSDPNAINVTGDPANVSFPREGYNSADPQRLLEFVQWASQFPAEHTVLVLWDHGSGWREGWKGGSALGRAAHRLRSPSGILCDDGDGAYDLTNNKFIVDTLAGYHFDIVAYDACLMSQLEALYDYRNLADWQVASEELVPGPGLPYDAILADWNAAFPLEPDEIGRIMCDEFQLEYPQDTVTMALVDSGKVDAMSGALGSLASSVAANAATEGELVKQAIKDAYGFDEGERDIKSFLDAYRAATADTGIQGLIDTALAQYAAMTVYYKQVGSDGSTGAAVFLPTASYFDDATQAEYHRADFDLATGWLAMLQATGVPNDGSTPGIEADWQAGDKVEISWTDPAADINLVITDPYGNYGWPGYGDELISEIDFSADNPGAGGTAEWAQLLPLAPAGAYTLMLMMVDYSGGSAPPYFDVAVKLYDSGGNLKQDLGVCQLELYTFNSYALLNNS